MTEAIAGLRYEREYLDRATHDRLLASVDSQPWLTSVDHGVQIYGFGYNHRERAAFRIGELPPWGAELAARLCRDRLLPGVPDQLVANNYEPGSGIFAHLDQAVFGDTVASVSLGSTCVMEFTRSGESREILLEPRSVLVLSGEARWSWRHGIAARTSDRWADEDLPRSRRVSLTFRIVGTAAQGENH